MDNEQLKKLYFGAMGLLMLGTFGFVMAFSHGGATGYATKLSYHSVMYPDRDYTVASCVDSLDGNIDAEIRDRDTGRVKFISLDKDSTQTYGCDGLRVLRFNH